MKDIVLDASALLALMNDENGADAVWNVLDPRTDHLCFLHAANAVEMMYKIASKSNAATARQQMDRIIDLGVIVRQDMDAEFQTDCVSLKTAFPALSLADVMALSLGKRLRATVLTSDKEFSEAGKLVKVEQFR